MLRPVAAVQRWHTPVPAPAGARLLVTLVPLLMCISSAGGVLMRPGTSYPSNVTEAQACQPLREFVLPGTLAYNNLVQLVRERSRL